MIHRYFASCLDTDARSSRRHVFFTVAVARPIRRFIDSRSRSPAPHLSLGARRQPFETVAICILLIIFMRSGHCQENDTPTFHRWSLIKSGFSRGLDVTAARSARHVVKREKGIWQRRYWEHAIRDDSDLARHVDYIHFNPVKHGLVSRVRDWPHSSFHRYVSRGELPEDWGGDMRDTSGSFGE